jgi:hypothetical protein
MVGQYLTLSIWSEPGKVKVFPIVNSRASILPQVRYLPVGYRLSSIPGKINPGSEHSLPDHLIWNDKRTCIVTDRRKVVGPAIRPNRYLAGYYGGNTGVFDGWYPGIPPGNTRPNISPISYVNNQVFTRVLTGCLRGLPIDIPSRYIGRYYSLVPAGKYLR